MNETTKQNNGLLPNGYDLWRKDIEALIDTAKLQTAINVNQGMLSLYWSIGKQILDKQEKLGCSVFINLITQICQSAQTSIHRTFCTIWNGC